MKETPYELLEDDQKKKIGKNNEANMTLYNALPRKEYERVFMCKTAKEKINSDFTRFNAIVTSLKSLDPDYSSKNHVRQFLHALPLKWRAMVYEMVLDNDGVASKTTTKEKVKSLALKAKVTREQTSDDSDSQDGNDEEVDKGCDAVRKAGISALVKCTSAIRQLAYAAVPNSLDEYLQIGEKLPRECIDAMRVTEL
ncbi:hypothetical protein Tco_1337366 [Tanacetum coccineum]